VFRGWVIRRLEVVIWCLEVFKECLYEVIERLEVVIECLEVFTETYPSAIY